MRWEGKTANKKLAVCCLLWWWCCGIAQTHTARSSERKRESAYEVMRVCVFSSYCFSLVNDLLLVAVYTNMCVCVCASDHGYKVATLFQLTNCADRDYIRWYAYAMHGHKVYKRLALGVAGVRNTLITYCYNLPSLFIDTCGKWREKHKMNSTNNKTKNHSKTFLPRSTAQGIENYD